MAQIVDRLRYMRNRETISQEDQIILKESKVCVVGCGGLGGYVIEGLARIGIGHLILADGDCFEPTNLNRQILSNEGNIGCAKTMEAADRVGKVNSSVQVKTWEEKFTEKNGASILRGCHAAVDALDNVYSRIILERACEKEKITLIHGAIGGWNGQVGVSRPGDRLLHKVYGVDWGRDNIENLEVRGEEAKAGNPSFIPMMIAGLQVAETIKVLLGLEGSLGGQLLVADTLLQEYLTVSL